MRPETGTSAYKIWQDPKTKEWLVSQGVILSIHGTEKEAKERVGTYEGNDARRAKNQ